MSDTRQSMTDKAASALKPDSQKGPVEQTVDHVSSAMQPNSQTSNSQRVMDAGDSMLNKAKNAVGMGNNNNTSN